LNLLHLAMFKLFEGENAKPSVNVIKNRGKPINYLAHFHRMSLKINHRCL
jgi:hypothetical protein